jgi:hypothetical protein
MKNFLTFDLGKEPNLRIKVKRRSCCGGGDEEARFQTNDPIAAKPAEGIGDLGE